MKALEFVQEARELAQDERAWDNDADAKTRARLAILLLAGALREMLQTEGPGDAIVARAQQLLEGL